MARGTVLLASGALGAAVEPPRRFRLLLASAVMLCVVALLGCGREDRVLPSTYTSPSTLRVTEVTGPSSTVGPLSSSRGEKATSTAALPTTTTVAGLSTSANAGPSTSPTARSSTPSAPDRLPSSTIPQAADTPTSPTSTTARPLARPARVRIPYIGVDARLTAVGLKANREMVVPDWVAGWYKPGPKPGEPGPAVLVAHRRWAGRPGVFHRLNELGPGDLIEVVYDDGRSVRFAVEDSELELKTRLPVNRIWNQTGERVLRLITCGGKFDKRTGHYVSNLIIYASVVEGR